MIKYTIIKFNYSNKINNKTNNIFYVHKSPINTYNNINKNIKAYRDYSNDKFNEDVNI